MNTIEETIHKQIICKDSLRLSARFDYGVDILSNMRSNVGSFELYTVNALVKTRLSITEDIDIRDVLINPHIHYFNKDLLDYWWFNSYYTNDAIAVTPNGEYKLFLGNATELLMKGKPTMKKYEEYIGISRKTFDSVKGVLLPKEYLKKFSFVPSISMDDIQKYGSIVEMKKDFILEQLIDKDILDSYLDTHHLIADQNSSQYHLFYGKSYSTLPIHYSNGWNGGDFAITLPNPKKGRTIVAPLVLADNKNTFHLRGHGIGDYGLYVVGKFIPNTNSVQ